MSTAIVLPTLSAWAEAHIRAFWGAKTDAAFNEAFEAFFAKDTSITVNGVHLTRAAVKEKMQALLALEASASVTFNNVVQVDKEKGNDFKAGSVGIFYTVTLTDRIDVHGAPVQKKITSSLNLIIEPDPTLHRPANIDGIHGYFDPRRVSKFSEVAEVVTK